MTDSKENENCPQRPLPDYNNVDPEKLAKFATAADILPLYEKSKVQFVYSNHYSLNTNKYLQCAWVKFKDGIVSRKKAPVELPGQSDVHFHNQAIKLIPSESVTKKSNFRKSLKPGPGVDYGGQMPIPNELITKRSAPKKEVEHKKVTKKKNFKK